MGEEKEEKGREKRAELLLAGDVKRRLESNSWMPAHSYPPYLPLIPPPH